MPDFRLQDGMDFEEAGLSGVTFTTTTNGSANVKGAWSQLTAATTRNATGIWVHTRCPSPGYSMAYQSAVDIGVGAAASEVVLIPNLSAIGWAGSYFLPISIPAGTRLSARSQGYASDGAYVGAMLISEGFASPSAFSRVTDYGMATAGATSPTQLTGGTGTAKGAWTQLVASTTHPCASVLASLWAYEATNTASYGAVDIGVGAGGSEVIVAGDLLLATFNSYSAGANPGIFNLPCSIPAGSRIAARYARSYADLAVYASVYGID